MPDRLSKLRRSRDRKPWDPHLSNLRKARGLEPSTGRNAVRMEQWRGGSAKNMGRRGKIKRQEEKKVNKQRRVNAEERCEELRRRPILAKKAAAKIARISKFCDEGLVVSAHKKGTKAYSPHVFSVDGLVERRNFTYGINPQTGLFEKLFLEPTVVRPWEEMHSRLLRMILRSNWAPKTPKSVLDQIVVATDNAS